MTSSEARGMRIRLRHLCQGVVLLWVSVSCVASPHTFPSVTSASETEHLVPSYPPAASEPTESSSGEAEFFGAMRQLTSIGRNGDASFSPRGNEIVYQTLRPPVDVERLVVNDFAGGRERIVHGVFMPATGAAATSTGLYYSFRKATADALWQLAENQDQVSRVISLPDGVQDARDAVYAASSGEVFFSAQAGKQRDLFVYDSKTGEVRQLTHTLEDDEGAPSPNANASQLAYWRGPRNGESEIFVLDRNLGQSRQLTALKSRNTAPSLHPQGRCVVFASAYYGEFDYDLFVVELQSGSIMRVTDHPGFDGLPRFSPDGTSLAWTSSRQGGVPQVFIAEWKR